MSCAPGSPCFGGGIVIGPSNPTNCGVDICSTHKTITDLVSYNGPNLSCSGIRTCDSLTTALQKLDDKSCIQNIFNEFITYITNNIEIYNIFCNAINGCIPTTTTTTTLPPLSCQCYTVTNTETVDGVVPYRIDYFDCNTVFQPMLVPKGTSVNVCALQGTIDPNFSNIIVDNGPCDVNCTTTTTTTLPPCNCLYFIYPVVEGLDQPISYNDCNGMLIEDSIKNGQILNFCGSNPTSTEFITVIETTIGCTSGGSNCEECTCHTVYNFGDFPVSFSYLQCSEAGIQFISGIVNSLQTLNICAIPGTISTNPNLVITNLGTSCLYPSQCIL